MGQMNWQDYVFGTLEGFFAILFVVTMMLLGVQKIRAFFARLKPPTSVDQTLAEMASAANAARAAKEVKHG